MNKFLKKLWQNRKSGLAVAMINIPLCLSLSIACGAGPIPGLLTGAWLGILMWIFGSSKHNIYGAAWSLAWILLPLALIFGPELLPIIGIISGLMMLLIYVGKLSKYIALIPSSALHGFMLGIALLIISTQLTSVFWLHDLESTPWVVSMLVQLFENLGSTNMTALAVFLISFVFLNIWKKIVPSFPGAIVLTVLWVGVGYAVQNWLISPIQLLSDSYPNVEFLPYAFEWISSIRSLTIDAAFISKILVASAWVAIIAILETLISAKIAQKETKVAFDNQSELRGLGFATIIASALGALPGAWVVVRTGMNVKNWASDKVSWLVTWVATLFLSWFLFVPALSFLPFACIAAILIDLSLGMINIKLYKKIRNFEKISLAIVLVVGFMAVLKDPLLAIMIGAVWSLMIFVKRIMEGNTHITIWDEGKVKHEFIDSLDPKDISNNAVVRVRLTGEMNYLTIDKQSEFLSNLHHVSAVILSFRATADIDMDAIEMLEDIVNHFKEVKTDIYLVWLSNEMKEILSHSDTISSLDESFYLDSSTSALNILL